MIDAKQFVEKLYEIGVSHICVVPCSFAKLVINEVIVNDHIEYIACANEAVAASICTGLRTSGQKPVLIIQSSGLTNAGSCLTSFSLPYAIYFPVIVSARTYKEGDSEVQHKQLFHELSHTIEAFGYSVCDLDRMDVDLNIKRIDSSFSSPTIIKLHKDTFRSTVDFSKQEIKQTFPKRSELIALLTIVEQEHFSLLGTTGNLSRELHAFVPDIPCLYMAGNMGGALSVGLGSALSGQKVVVCGGDAEFAMHMGGLVTAGRYSSLSGKLIYIVFDNEMNKSTGGQPTYQAHVDYIGIAKASGFSIWEDVISDIDEFQNALQFASHSQGSLFFIHVKCSNDPVQNRPCLKTIIDSKNVFCKEKS